MLDKLSPPVRGLILDMDGVLWKDDTPIGDLPAIFDRIQSRGLKVTLATNNASKTVNEYLEKLRGSGVTLEPVANRQFVGGDGAGTGLPPSPPEITISSNLGGVPDPKGVDKGGKAVFVIGENGIVSAFARKRFYTHNRSQ